MSTLIKTPNGWKTVANVSESADRYKRETVFYPEYAYVAAPVAIGPKCNEFTVQKTGIYNYIIHGEDTDAKLGCAYIVASIPSYNIGYYQMNAYTDRVNDTFYFTGLLKKGEKVSYCFYSIPREGQTNAQMYHRCQLTLLEDLSDIFND